MRKDAAPPALHLSHTVRGFAFQLPLYNLTYTTSSRTESMAALFETLTQCSASIRSRRRACVCIVSTGQKKTQPRSTSGCLCRVGAFEPLKSAECLPSVFRNFAAPNLQLPHLETLGSTPFDYEQGCDHLPELQQYHLKANRHPDNLSSQAWRCARDAILLSQPASRDSYGNMNYEQLLHLSPHIDLLLSQIDTSLDDQTEGLHVG